MTDPHFLLSAIDVPAHLARDHARQVADLDALAASVTDGQLADYLSRVDTDDAGDLLRALVAHEHLHDEFGDDH